MATLNSSTSKDLEAEHTERHSSPEHLQDVHSDYEDEKPFKFTFKLFLVFMSFQLGFMADVFVVGMARTDFSYIVQDIGAAPNNYAWILVSINLAGSVLTPVIGRLSDFFGRKMFLLIANLFGLVGCAVSARVHSQGALIGAGVIVGIGQAGHSLALTCIGEMVPRRQRIFAQGLFQGSLIPAAAFSPLIAHAFVLHTTWRDIYWMAMAHNIGSFVGIALFYHPVVRQKTAEQLAPFGTRMKRLDWGGPILYTTMLTLVAIGLLFGHTVYHWVSVGVLLPALLGAVLIMVFIAWEFFKCSSPWAFLPRPLVTNWRGFGTLTFVLFLSGIGDATTIFWSEEVQLLFTQKQIPMGVYGMAHGIAGPAIAPLVGYLVQRGFARWWLTFFVVGFTVVCGAQATLSAHSQASSTALAVLSGGFYTAISVAGYGMIQVAARHQDLGIATGLAQSLRTYGGAMTSIIAPVMLTNKLTSQVKTRLVPALIQAGIPLQNLQAAVASILAGVFTSPALAGASPLGLLNAGHVLQSCYIHAFAYVYEICVLFGGLAIIFCLFTQDLKKYMTPEVEVGLEKSKGFLPPDVERMAERRKNKKSVNEGSNFTGNDGA